MIPAFLHSDETQACNLIFDDAETARILSWLLLPQLRDCNVIVHFMDKHVPVLVVYLLSFWYLIISVRVWMWGGIASLFEDMINDTVQCTGSLCCQASVLISHPFCRAKSRGSNEWINKTLNFIMCLRSFCEHRIGWIAPVWCLLECLIISFTICMSVWVSNTFLISLHVLRKLL